MGAFAWYYNDHEADVCYWAYSYEYSTTRFAEEVSAQMGKHISFRKASKRHENCACIKLSAVHEDMPVYSDGEHRGQNVGDRSVCSDNIPK